MPIVYKNAPDGMIHVCVPAISVDDPEGFSVEDSYTRALGKDIPKDATAITRINHGDIDLTDVFRNAWTVMNADKSFQYDGTIAQSIVDQSLQSEMAGHAAKLDLLTKLGRDTTAVQASITDCKSRVSQLDNMQIAKSPDTATLATLKSLIK